MEKFLFKKISVWIVIILLILIIFLSLLFAWAAQYYSSGKSRGGVVLETIHEISNIPHYFIEIIYKGIAPSMNDQIIKFKPFKGLKKFDRNFNKSFLLISAYDKKNGSSLTYLFDIKQNKIVHLWKPDVEKINKQLKDKTKYIWTREDFEMLHPYLNNDYSLVFTSGEGPLVKIDQCSNIDWVIDSKFHHSIEKDSSNNYLVPITLKSKENYFKKIYGEDTIFNLSQNLQDDAIAVVSPDGKILKTISITKALIDNGYGSYILNLLSRTNNAIHLNDIEPIKENDEYVKEGDVAISLRSLSAVALYRPSENKIIWLKFGPWSEQHDVDYLGDGLFSIFGNDSNLRLGTLRGYSTIYQYDMKNDKVIEFLKLKESNIFASRQGLHKINKDGSIFIEQSENGILHLINKNGKHILKYVHSIDKNEIGSLHWSRYFLDDEIKNMLKANVNCKN
jgi:hypothetical protein